MHYDDLADHKSNPTPGIVVNKINGTDVYKTPYQVPKHYTKADVTPENFLALLRGDEELEKKGKKVVKSGPNDRIFVYLDDHGGHETVAFPTSVLHAKDLNDILKAMHKDNKYKELVFYLAACYAGSMFYKDLPADINAYALAGTRPDELGWFSNCGPSKYNTHDLNKEVLNDQYEYLKSRGDIENQHAQQYGDLTIAKEHVIKYVEELNSLLNGRKLMDKQIEEYVNELPGIDANIALNGKLELNHRDCYRKLVDTFNDKCYTFGQNTYGIQKLHIFVNICEQMRDSSDADIAVNRLIQHCNRNVMKPNNII
ncbi:unnamed protein product [Oppiella nova]|uniref:Legumain prodomain domain-containing protein n=1 Tax=Oppiella nova TaxID=334625 RepID=A0A7R9LZ00_9ACAR|nr:unnamed protein product [Oppiella nova]CAG2168367.1 unnamed protein product [Oppiella nova]